MPESIRKYGVIIRKFGVPIVQPMTSFLYDMYVNRSLILFLEGYEHFTLHVKTLDPTNRAFLQSPSITLLFPSLFNPSLLLLFPYLLLTQNATNTR